MTNLYQANSVNTNDDDFSKEKIIDGVRISMYPYKDYLNKAIAVVHKAGGLFIPLSHKKVKINKLDDEGNVMTNKNGEPKQIEEIRYYLVTDNLGSKKNTIFENELFEKEDQKLYKIKPTGNNQNDEKNRLYPEKNIEEKYLIFNQEEILNGVYLKANDYQLNKQKQAIYNLVNRPLQEHTAIQKLFDLSYKAKDYFSNNLTNDEINLNWKVLTDDTRNGTVEQRNFVRKALRTTDFALLEGPPGSGKTTAIIELIIQLVKQNKRILLVSSTHVAVDNVIHRILTTYKEQCQGLVVPIRIGDQNSIRKESVKPYRYQDFVKKTKEEIKQNLRNNLNTKSKQILYESINSDDKSLDNLILKSANLVAGTMIGILQHPDIKKHPDKEKGIQEMFDVMIVDESSKVTFLDFIVPALYAKKWILVGDVKQLSPYTEDAYINEAIDELLDNKTKEKLKATFMLHRKLNSKYTSDKKAIKILFSDLHNKEDFKDNLVLVVNKDYSLNNKSILKLNAVDIIICRKNKQAKQIVFNNVFVKALTFENDTDTNIAFKNRQKFFHQKTKRREKGYHRHAFNVNLEEWKKMVGNIMSQMYQYRFDKYLYEDLKKEYDFLVPKNIQNKMDNIRKIALPSMLELLQIGVGETKSKSGKIQKKLIYDGFKQFKEITDAKFQSLSYQHRMNDDIASISRIYFYENENLKTANTVSGRENILKQYEPNETDVIWIANNDTTFKKTYKNINHKEVTDIKNEIKNFLEFAKNHKRQEDYELTVITFYREQEMLLKKMLQKLSRKQQNNYNFKIGNVKITLSTVDTFQGDEADIILLSFTKFSERAFYNSPNRLNVALTRAKYKLVLFGNKAWFKEKASSKALKELATKFKERVKIK